MLDDFFIRAVLAGIGLALVTGPTGCFIVWRRLAYFGETIAHSALLGVAIAIVVDLHLALGIFAIASAMVLAMFYLERRDTLPTDTLLGLMSHGGLALGLFILSFFPDMRLDLHALLFGDILAVSRVDLAMIWVGGAAAAARPRASDVRDPGGGGDRRGDQDRRRSADRRLADNPRRHRPPLRLEPGKDGGWRRGDGVAAVAGGLLASANLGTPSGPSIVVVALALFIVTRAGGPRPG